MAQCRIGGGISNRSCLRAFYLACIIGANVAGAGCANWCVVEFQDALAAMCSLDSCATCKGCDTVSSDCAAPCNHLSATARADFGQGETTYSSRAISYGEASSLFDVSGGCGGRDIGKCGATAEGKLYAWYLDAIAWCEDAEPGSGFRVGKAVSEGCSIATRAGYFTQCCVVNTSSSPSSSPWPLLVLVCSSFIVATELLLQEGVFD